MGRSDVNSRNVTELFRLRGRCFGPDFMRFFRIARIFLCDTRACRRPNTQALLLLLTSLRRYALLIWLALSAPFGGKRRLGGAMLVLLALPLFLIWQGLHWLGFLLDEILYPGYRKVQVRDPLFIVGPPRTGTTHLHHVMSGDEKTTTFRTWECLFALSITGRKLCLGLAALDRSLGRPAARLGAWLSRGLLRSMDDIHPLALGDPEEDFLCLMPLAACFLLVVPFPGARWLWQTARLDTAADAGERQRLMRYYRRCIQKHLYVFGPDLRFLSKNASFSGFSQALLDEFPDARILATVRDPLAAVPSQLSSLKPGLAVCGFARMPPDFRDALVDLLAFYYEHLADVADRHPDRIAFIPNDDLKHRLEASVTHALETLSLDLSPQFAGVLKRASEASREHRSSHRYSLDEFDLSEELIRSRFQRSYVRYGFDVNSLCQ